MGLYDEGGGGGDYMRDNNIVRFFVSLFLLLSSSLNSVRFDTLHYRISMIHG